jgi:uncharacterized protein YecT (DUF1311 family)
LCDKAYTTIELNQCAESEYQKADKNLNVAYQAALTVSESIDEVQQRKDTRQSLIEGQRFWVKFRDKDCDAVYNLWSGGTIRGVMYWGCMIDRTKQRTKELESFTFREPQT